MTPCSSRSLPGNLGVQGLLGRMTLCVYIYIYIYLFFYVYNTYVYIYIYMYIYIYIFVCFSCLKILGLAVHPMYSPSESQPLLPLHVALVVVLVTPYSGP